MLKSQEINLDYILEQIFEKNKKTKDKVSMIEDVRRMIRSNIGNRAKESLLVDFINKINLDEIGDKASVIEAFFAFAQAEKKREANELIISEGLNEELANDNGEDLNNILPKMSPLNPEYLPKKKSVFQKISNFVEKFKGIGGEI